MAAVSGADHSEIVAALLPGQWRLMATSRRLWLDKLKLAPTVDFSVVRPAPLTLDCSFEWAVPGKRRRHTRVRLRMDSEGFLASRGVLFNHSRVRRVVAGASDDSAIVVLMVTEFVSYRLGHGAGETSVEILLRAGELSEGLRASVARSAVDFGLSAEYFAGLAWADERGQF